jgi:hypothetical protein
MSLQTKTATTQTTASKIWRKAQGTAVDAINFEVDELRLINSLSSAKLAPSLREVSRPVFITRGGGVASISEAGAKARPQSPPPQELTCSLVHLQKQFAIADLVLMITKMGGSDAQLVKQFKAQLRMAVNSMKEGVGDYFYGASSGILALTDTDLSGATTELTLYDGYNQSWLDDPAYLANRFQAAASTGDPDWVHVLNSGTLVTNAYGYVSARNTTTGTITITWNGSAPSSSTNGLQIVKANSLESTANDYNKAFVGLTEQLTAVSTHGLSSSDFPDGWAPSFTDTSGGRLDGTRIERGLDGIDDKSPFSADTVIWSKGVKRDVKAQYKAALEFTDAYAIPMDGAVKYKGLDFFTSRRVPPTFACAFAKKAWEKFFWKPTIEDQDGMTEADLLPSEDYTFQVGRLDLIGNLVCNCRTAFAYWRSLDES